MILEYGGVDDFQVYVYSVNDCDYTNKVKTKYKEKMEEAAKLRSEFEEQKGKDAPTGDIANDYITAAYWLVADHMYNNASKTKAMAVTDDGLKTLIAWRDEWNRHIKGGKEITKDMPDGEKYSEANILYTARLWVEQYIAANKDQGKIDDIADNAIQTSGEILTMILKSYTDGKEREPHDFDDVLSNIGDYKPNDLDGDSSGKIENITSKILTIVTNIGIAVSVIILAILGIKYMLGSVEEKAEYKQSLIPYVVGAFMLFGITGFVKILMTFGDLIANI